MTHTPLSALRWIFADVVSGGTRSWPKAELVDRYGKYAVEELLKMDCLKGDQHLVLTKKGAHCALVGRID